MIKVDKFRKFRLVVAADLNFVVCSVVCYISSRLSSSLCVLCISSLTLSLVFALCFVCCVFCLVSHFCLMSCVLRLLPCFSLIWILFLFKYSISARFFLPLPCVFYIAFFALSPTFALCLVCCVFCLVSRFVSYALRLSPCLLLLRFHFYLRIVDLLFSSLYIISLDKQSFVELVAHQYRYFVWRY